MLNFPMKNVKDTKRLLLQKFCNFVYLLTNYIYKVGNYFTDSPCDK